MKAKEKAALDAIGEKGVTSKPSSGPSNTLNSTSNSDPKTDDLLDLLKDQLHFSSCLGRYIALQIKLNCQQVVLILWFVWLLVCFGENWKEKPNM